MSSEKVPPSVRPNNRNQEYTGTCGTRWDKVEEEVDVHAKDLEGDEGSDTGEDGEAPCDPVGPDEVDGQEEGEEEGEDHATPAGLRDPGQPTPTERAEHELTHIPYRSWCAH